jgi:hypothetical protein
MNYQQEAGYYEVNPIYGEHPSQERIYLTKAAEIGLVYVAARIFPEYETAILIGANVVLLGVILYDNKQGISMSVRF